MELVVVKSGPEMFDALHAYGVAIVIASASDAPVEIRDEGLAYRLVSSISGLQGFNNPDLADILALPAPELLEQEVKRVPEACISIANLDGLLAALFTIPGVRLVSVGDLLSYRQHRPAVIEDGLKKVNRAVSRWEKYVRRISKGSGSWLALLNQDYHAASPANPSVKRKERQDLTAVMTLDPSFAFSMRRSISDGLITDKTNVTITGPRLAVLFALIGAARFLRAQRVAGRLVNLYVPLPKAITIWGKTAVPLLDSTEASSSQAVIYHWLAEVQQAALPDAKWKGLAYQTLQTQGASQSISVGRGYLDYEWLNSLKERVGSRVINYWKVSFSRQPEQLSFELDNLIDVLTSRSAPAWLIHLRELSLCSLEPNASGIRPYTYEELKEITRMMVPSSKTAPISTIIEREEGTARFGRALRLLGQINNVALSEIIDDLDSAHTPERLTRIGATIAQQCEVAGAKSKFIIVPTETDLKILLDDIDQYGPRSIADLLISLSFVRYPLRMTGEDSDESGLQPIAQESQGGN